MTYKDWNELRNAFIKLNNKIDEKICDWDVSQELTHVWNLIDAQYELDKLESRITNLTILKDKNIDDILKNNNNNKFANVKVVLRNILLGVLFVFCFFKIYKI